MLLGVPQFILIVLLAEIVTAAIFNGTLDELDNDLMLVKTRRHAKKHISTSSSMSRKGDGKGGYDKSSDDTLGESFSGATSSTDTDEKKGNRKQKVLRKSSEGRKGWRKWHRKCTPCGEDMRKKWRDPSIKWICGAYQRARRTFKSLCMMHYRNCQDGTMFTKIADHRCANATGEVRPYGEHFFYDYKVFITDDDDSSEEDDDATSVESQSSSWDSARIRTIPSLPPINP